jgi:hypothetical protein
MPQACPHPRHRAWQVVAAWLTRLDMAMARRKHQRTHKGGTCGLCAAYTEARKTAQTRGGQWWQRRDSPSRQATAHAWQPEAADPPRRPRTSQAARERGTDRPDPAGAAGSQPEHAEGRAG